MMSANANPWVVLRELISCRQDVTSVVLRSVVRILFMSAGCGEAIHSYIVVSVIVSRFMSFSAGFGVPFK